MRQNFLYDFTAQRSTIKTLFIKLYFVFTSNQNTIQTTLKILRVRLHFAFMNEDITLRRSTAIPGLFSRVIAGVPSLAMMLCHRKSRDQITGSASYTVG